MAKFHMFRERIALVCTKISEIFSQNSFFPEIPRKNLYWIWDETRKVSGKIDEYSPMKKIKQFHTQTNLPFSPGSDK